MTLDEATDVVEDEQPKLDDSSDGSSERRTAYCMTIDAARDFDELFRHGLPTCIGRHVSGSGGHGSSAHDCDELATWSSWPDGGMHLRYCDACSPPGKHGLRELPWAYVVRIAYALTGGRV